MGLVLWMRVAIPKRWCAKPDCRRRLLQCETAVPARLVASHRSTRGIAYCRLALGVRRCRECARPQGVRARLNDPRAPFTRAIGKGWRAPASAGISSGREVRPEPTAIRAASTFMTVIGGGVSQCFLLPHATRGPCVANSHRRVIRALQCIRCGRVCACVSTIWRRRACVPRGFLSRTIRFSSVFK